MPPIDVVSPEFVGLSTERLGRIEQHLRRRYVDAGKVAGTLTLVARKDQVAYCEALGQMDLERGKPMTEDTMFRIYSMSKPITSVALMMLFEEGHFQLSDPVHRFIPEWRHLGVFEQGSHPAWLTRPCERPMTIHDLFTHQSGLTYGFMQRTNVDRAYRRLKIGREGNKDLREMIEAPRDGPARILPGDPLELLGRNRCVGLSRRGDLRHAFR